MYQRFVFACWQPRWITMVTTTIPVKSRLLTAMPTMLKRMKTIMQISSLLSAIPGPYDFNCSLNTVLRAVSEQCSDTALRTAQYVTMSLTHSHFDFGTHREILDTLENAFKEQSLKQ